MSTIRCPVCNRYVSAIGKGKVARHNNYNTRAPGTRWAYLPCRGSGADAADLVAAAKREAEVAQVRRDVVDAENRLRRAREDADKATAWAATCFDRVTALRAKYAAMQAPEPDEAAVTMSAIATVEVSL